MKRGILFILCIAALLLLAGCKGECKTASDCTAKSAKAFTAQCTDKKCVYTPIPNVCGNAKCEPPGENKGNCEVDCGVCAGKVSGSQYLEYTVVGDKCLESIPDSKVQPVYTSSDLTSAGDKFKIDTVYNSPFNVKKDTFNVVIKLVDQGTTNRDEHILNMELTATTQDKRTITIGQIDVDKYIWTEGSMIEEDMILDFPTAEIEGELTNLLLKVQYEYAIVQAGKKTIKQTTLQNRYKEKFTFVKPTANYPCPKCDDKNPGTRDVCGPQTNFFCKYETITGACGNFKCDGNENKCTCPQDCGICSGSAGNFLDYTCANNKCITELKTGVSVQPNTIFDDRSLGPIRLHNNYKYSNPFDITKDSIELDFTIYQSDPDITGFAIETVRVIEGTQQLAEAMIDKEVSKDTATASIKIPTIIEPEEDHQLTLGIWYKFSQGGEEKLGNFQKPLGKVTLIRPG